MNCEKNNIKEVEHMVKQRVRFLAVVLLVGMILSLMAVMMRLGGSINFEEFLSADRVYDFSKETLTKSSTNWQYIPERNGYMILKDKASKKFKLDGKEQVWNILYLTIEEMSVPCINGTLISYNCNGERVLEQAIQLVEGENRILLNAEIPMYQIAVMILDSEGEFISIKAMQIRTTLNWFTLKHFMALFSVVYGLFLLGLIIIIFVFHRIERKRKEKCERLIKGIKKSLYIPIDILQYAYCLFGDFLGRRISGNLKREQRRALQIYFLCILFLWMIIGNVLNWNSNESIYRYHVLVCVILLIMSAIITWEKPLQPIRWNNFLMGNWFVLWVGVAISDLFVKKETGALGCVMLAVGGFFIFVIQNTGKSQETARSFMIALEITFAITTAFCMIFRIKGMAIYYNGVFCSPDENAMFASLMVSIFLMELKQLLVHRTSSKRNTQKYILYITGMSIAAYFVLRSESVVGYVAIGMVTLHFCLCYFSQFKFLWKDRRSIIIGCLVGFVAVCIVHISVTRLPEALQLEVAYENEILITDVSEELQDAINQYKPGIMDNVIRTEKIEVLTIWKSYIRRLNLMGHRGNEKVFRQEVPVNSGYIEIAYRYGVFILVPYLVLQVGLAFRVIKCSYKWNAQKTNRKRSINFMIFSITVIYICFSFFGNAERVWGHPLWLCFYLLPFAMQEKY